MRKRHGALLLGLLFLVVLPASAADTLGRLFMTPEQRHALDSLRETGADSHATAGTLAPAGVTPVERPVVLNGVVRRSRGPDVVWVNGARAGAPDSPIRLRLGPDPSNRVTLEGAADGISVRLKPGQFWDPTTRRVANCYGCDAPATSAAVEPAPVEATADKP
jgi:hypothetical protein